MPAQCLPLGGGGAAQSGLIPSSNTQRTQNVRTEGNVHPECWISPLGTGSTLEPSDLEGPKRIGVRAGADLAKARPSTRGSNQGRGKGQKFPHNPRTTAWWCLDTGVRFHDVIQAPM